MIRISLLICSLFFINSYALVSNDTTKKNIPVDAHIDHPDHVPHNHGGKDPVKKVTQDEIVFPRKKKKKIWLLVT